MPDFQKKNRLSLNFITCDILNLVTYGQMAINQKVVANENDPEEHIIFIINNN